MDLFEIHNMNKMQKTNAMQQYHQFQKLAKLFRVIELFTSLVFFSWISSHLPFVIRMCIEYFRHLVSIIVNPLFIFLIGNVIIVTLVVKSSKVDDNSSQVDDDSGSELLYDVIANNVTEDANNISLVTQEKEIVYEDKGIVSEVIMKQDIEATNVCSRNLDSDVGRKVYRRSESEKLMKKSCLEADKGCGKLKRSETEMRRRREDDSSDVVVDELSNEEFQKRIEGFIARQKLAIVAHN